MRFRDPKTGEMCDLQGLLLAWIKFRMHRDTDWAKKNVEEVASLMGYEVVYELGDDTSPLEVVAQSFSQIEKEANMDNPCIGCDVGWESISSAGTMSCRDECERLKAWEAKKKVDKPRICEVLGVDSGEKFCITYTSHAMRITRTCWIDKNGDIVSDGGRLPAEALSQIINHPDFIIRKPRFTEQEAERAKTIKVICPDADRIRCRFYENKGRVQHVCEGNRTMFTIWFDAFPSIQTDEYAKLDEIIGGAD